MPNHLRVASIHHQSHSTTVLPPTNAQRLRDCRRARSRPSRHPHPPPLCSHRQKLQLPLRKHLRLEVLRHLLGAAERSAITSTTHRRSPDFQSLRAHLLAPTVRRCSTSSLTPCPRFSCLTTRVQSTTLTPVLVDRSCMTKRQGTVGRPINDIVWIDHRNVLRHFRSLNFRLLRQHVDCTSLL